MRSFPPVAERGWRMTMSISRPSAVSRPQRLYSTLEAEETLSVEVDHQVGQLVEDLREPAGTPPPDPSFAPFRGASQAHG